MSGNEDDRRPLSGAQEGLWYAHRLAPGTAAYNTGEYVEIHGPLDTAVFETALRRTVREADTFALRFLDTPDGPRAVRDGDPDEMPVRGWTSVVRRTRRPPPRSGYAGIWRLRWTWRRDRSSRTPC